MGDVTCSVPGCRYAAHARGLCATHNWRMKQYGSTDKPPPRCVPAVDRFFAKVDVGDCWLWTGTLAGGGYGWFQGEGGRSTPAHRWSYEHLVGAIPDGLDLDHLCRVRRCVNPDHLEPVTRAENMRRAPWDAARFQRAKTHCPHGHPYVGHNILMDGGRRRCRTCRNVYERAVRARAKAGAA